MKSVYRGIVLVTSLVLLLLVFGLEANAEVLVSDDFNRAANNCLGTMSDGAHGWYEIEGEKDNLVRGSGTAACMSYHSGVIYCTGAAVYGFTLADGTVSVKVHWLAIKYGGKPGISYRADTLENACNAYNGQNAYHIRISPNWAGKNDIELVYGHTVLATADISDEFAAFDLSVTFKLNSHKVYVNGELKIDYTEITPERTGAGYIGIGLYASAVNFDNFQVSNLTELL